MFASRLSLIAGLLLFLLVACAGTTTMPTAVPTTAPVAVAPTTVPPTATVSPTATKSPNPTGTAAPSATSISLEGQAADLVTPTPFQPVSGQVPARCLSSDITTVTYFNIQDRFCLRYPANMRLYELPNSHVVDLWGPVHNPPPGMRVSLTIGVKPANGKTLDQVFAAELANFPSIANQIGHTTATLGGQPAIITDDMPGNLHNRLAFVVYDDRVFQLVLQPYNEPALSPLRSEWESAWQTVSRSWSFW